MKFEAYSTVDRGLEDIAVEDLRDEHNIKAEYKDYMGKIFFQADVEQIIDLNLKARSINRVIIKLKESQVSNLDDIKREVRDIDFSQFIDVNQTFAVKSTRLGKHKFTSLDIARVGGKAIIDSFLDSTGKKLKVNLSDPDVRVIIEVLNNKLLVGIDTTGLSLHIRRYRKFDHPLPIKTTIAYDLIRMIKWDGKSELLDPTCGSGTILIEAAAWMRAIPICLTRRLEEYQLLKLGIIDKEKVYERCNKLKSEIKWDKKAPLYGVEINKIFIEGAKMNSSCAKVGDTIEFINGDATKLEDYFDKGSIPYVVSNPPYMLPDKKKLKKFYEGYIKSLDKVLTSNGKALILTTERGLFDTYLQETKFKVYKERVIPYGSINVHILMLSHED